MLSCTFCSGVSLQNGSSSSSFFVVQCAVSIRLKASATTHFDDFHCYDQDYYYFCCCCCCCPFPLHTLLSSSYFSPPPTPRIEGQQQKRAKELSVFPFLLLLLLPSFLHFFTLLASFRQFFPFHSFKAWLWCLVYLQYCTKLCCSVLCVFPACGLLLFLCTFFCFTLFFSFSLLVHHFLTRPALVVCRSCCSGCTNTRAHFFTIIRFVCQ